jgi:hypothetical protein
MSEATSTKKELPADPATGQLSAVAHLLTGALTPRMAPGALAALYHAFIAAKEKREDQA